jgi:uncharacterized protein (TIGR02266 family)
MMTSSGTQDPRNRRRAERVRLCEPVRLRGEGRLSHSRALAINLSSTGLFVAADQPVDVGERLRCELSFLPRSPIDVACRVVWVRSSQEGDHGPTGMGLAFEDLTGSRSERIEQLLSRLQRPAAAARFPAVDPFAESGTWAPAEIFDERDDERDIDSDPRSLKLALVLAMLVIAGLLSTIALLLLR